MSLETCPRVIVGGDLLDGTGRPHLEDSVIIIDGEWIQTIGRRGETPIPEGAELIDASSKTVIPGFIDAHTHFLWMGIRMQQYVDLSATQSLSEALRIVKEKVDDAGNGEWVLGRGWDESKWQEGRYITKEDLDIFSPNHPIMLTRVCGHLITLNSKALELSQITRETEDPPRGQLDRDSYGEPTGILRDARELVESVIPTIDVEQATEGLSKACDLALSLGCTGVQEAGIDSFGLRTYQAALNAGKLRVRAYLMVRSGLIETVLQLGIQTGFGNEMLRVGSAKMLIDGSLGARTAALFEPYEDEPSKKGLLLMEPQELTNLVKQVHREEIQVAIHAIGDRGVEYAINSLEEAMKEAPRKGHRHRIEHSEIMTTTQIERFGQLDVVASMQPNFVGEWGRPGGMYEARLGKKRWRQNNPLRSLLDEGVHVAFGSDCMPFNPLYGVWCAVNHPIRENRISLEEAVKGYTLDSAYASFEEDLKGSIEPGKLADIVIMDGDLREMPSDRFEQIPVYMTVVGGKILYHRE